LGFGGGFAVAIASRSCGDISEGDFACVDYEYFETPDKDNISRRAIRFVLEKAVGESSETSQSTSSQPSSRHKKPTKTERKGLVTSRVGQGCYRQELCCMASFSRHALTMTHGGLLSKSPLYLIFNDLTLACVAANGGIP
jgi:hypothetical protein